MPIYLIDTITFTQERLELSLGATVAQAREALARKWKCPPTALYFLLDGRVLQDDHRLEPESGYARPKHPVVYRQVPLGGAPPPSVPAVAPPRSVDPSNFVELVENLMSVFPNQYDRAAVEAVLRKANYDSRVAVEDILARPPPPKAAIPPEHLERIRKAKPPAMSIEKAVTIYKEVCQGDIDTAELVLLDAQP
jgi:hypothetical protein